MTVNVAQKQETLRSSGNSSHPILDNRPCLGEDTPHVGALWDIPIRLQVKSVLRVAGDSSSEDQSQGASLTARGCVNSCLSPIEAIHMANTRPK